VLLWGAAVALEVRKSASWSDESAARSIALAQFEAAKRMATAASIALLRGMYDPIVLEDAIRAVELARAQLKHHQ
jgi:hypothetical protein